MDWTVCAVAPTAFWEWRSRQAALRRAEAPAVGLPDGRWLHVRVARSFLQRMCGLLGTGPGSLRGGVLALVPCSSIHTRGMAYAIDVAFIDRYGRVLAAERDLGPGGLRSCRGAWATLERESDGTPWVEAGDLLQLHGLHT